MLYAVFSFFRSKNPGAKFAQSKTTKTVTKIRVDRAYIVGLIPFLASEYTRVEMVSIPAPLVKCVMIKSSRLMVKASKKPDKTPGIISGSTTLKKA